MELVLLEHGRTAHALGGERARTAGMFVYRTDFTVPTTVTVRRNLESGRLTADHISYAPVIYQLSRSKHELSLSI